MSEPGLGHPGACLSTEEGGNSIELWKMPQAWVGRELGCQLKKGVLLFKGQISWLFALALVCSFIHSRNLGKELPYFGVVCLALSLEGQYDKSMFHTLRSSGSKDTVVWVKYFGIYIFYELPNFPNCLLVPCLPQTRNNSRKQGRFHWLESEHWGPEHLQGNEEVSVAVMVFSSSSEPWE